MSDAYQFETEEIAPSVWLHHLPTDKLKTNRLLVCWAGNVDETLTTRALLPSVLVRGTRSHPNLRDVNQHLERLYGSGISADVSRIGTHHVMSFRADFVNDRYLPGEETIFDDVTQFLGDVLNDPVLDHGVFPADTVQQEKSTLSRHIEGLLNDKSSFAFQRLLQVMCPDEPFSRYEYGTLEALSEIEAPALSELWKNVSRTSPTHIYASGDLKPEVIRSAALGLVGERGAVAALSPPPNLVSSGGRRDVIESMDIAQTHLVLGYRTGVRFGDPESAALVMANGILGQFAHSKLFQNVREKASLCYSVHSHLDRSAGQLFIAAGVPDAKRDEAIDLIGQQLKAVQAGDVTDDELSATRLAYENRLEMIEDNPAPLMSIDLAWRLSGTEYQHQNYRDSLQAVSRDEIIAASQRIELDTVFALTPEKAE